MKIISWLFGILVFAIGLLNTFWGNDPGYGIALLLLSLVYFPPVTDFFTLKTGIKVPVWAKIVLGLLILWTALGVAELFDKLDLMINDLSGI